MSSYACVTSWRSYWTLRGMHVLATCFLRARYRHGIGATTAWPWRGHHLSVLEQTHPRHCQTPYTTSLWRRHTSTHDTVATPVVVVIYAQWVNCNSASVQTFDCIQWHAIDVDSTSGLMTWTSDWFWVLLISLTGAAPGASNNWLLRLPRAAHYVIATIIYRRAIRTSMAATWESGKKVK